ncbi:MAG TPA: branched-chain amino acid ABC transporter permease [Lachnoclostridium phytofermentans]|uniref:Autoinducer 2 import system permease protein LsrD n=1 Tax=Lachnoclostridium phytofermentans TaxID=66219 RepID=A0A3D2X5M1_9FIRM|nr:ABC transporter permease [Lachnoclostridium sp.]HCL02440.1 branched-chain amino acid ABC transporter permease [Lachnoclostridium phytofermentans]
MASKSGRVISTDQKFSLNKFLFRWETFLVIVFIAVNIMNITISNRYWSVNGLFNATNTFLCVAFLTLPMCFVLLIGEIDISVGSQVALAAVILGVSFNAGCPMWLSIIIAVTVGAACGLLNGIILVTFYELNPMIVTLGTQILYRGIAEMILKDQATGGFTSVKWFSKLYWGKVGGVVPIMFLVFVVCAIIFGIVMHKSTFGRRMFAVGSNQLAARYSGINIPKMRIIIYTLAGIFSGICAIFVAAQMGSARPNIGTGYEMDAIGMCVLGGVLTDGGKGNFIGAMIAVFLLGFLEYGLGLVNISSNIMMVVKGVLLIFAVMVPNLNLGKILKRDSKEV